MVDDKNLAIFEDYKIRRSYDEKTETWYFSVVDIIKVLIQQQDFQASRKYWNKLKERLKKEGNESVTNCHQLKLLASDGKKYATNVANAQTLLRLIQSIPSPKAEPIKLWLAKVGYERMQEMTDPSKSLDRARETWQKHGRSKKWIQQRMTGQETRNKLADYWKEHDIKEKDEFAILTNIIHREWTGLSVNEHRKLKNIKSQNLRDHMGEAELIFTALAETSNATSLKENKTAGKEGGKIAKQAKTELENKTGKKVITEENFLPPKKTIRKSKK